jgi:bacterioferritin
MLGNWGFGALESHVYESSIAAMKESDSIVKRVLFLEGLPNLQDLGKLMIGEDVPEILRCDLALERRYRDALSAAIVFVEGERDFVSRHHLEEIQEASEERIDWLETQLTLIEAVGLPNYLESAI